MSATTHATPRATAPATVLQGISAAFSWMQGVLDTYFDIVACRDEIARLQSLADEELRQLGLTRDEIVAFAYRRHLRN